MRDVLPIIAHDDQFVICIVWDDPHANSASLLTMKVPHKVKAIMDVKIGNSNNEQFHTAGILYNLDKYNQE